MGDNLALEYKTKSAKENIYIWEVELLHLISSTIEQIKWSSYARGWIFV